MALSVIRNHQPRSQMAAKFFCAQVNELVKWSITVAAHCASFSPVPLQTGTLLQSDWCAASHSVACSRCPRPITGYRFSGIGSGFGIAFKYAGSFPGPERTPRQAAVSPTVWIAVIAVLQELPTKSRNGADPSRPRVWAEAYESHVSYTEEPLLADGGIQ